MNDAKECPWCKRWCLKDSACNYIFSCGLNSENKFIVGAGCGRSWCWLCEKKFCTQYTDIITGLKLSTAKDNHSSCCFNEEGFSKESYCCGGHNSHCEKRW